MSVQVATLRITVSCFLLTGGLVTDAQVLVRTFNRDTTAFYRAEEMLSVRFDSIIDLGNGDSLLYNYYITESDSGLPVPCTTTIVDTPWTGLKIRMRANHEDWFYNRWGDSILLATSMESGPLDTYTMYTFPDGRYIEAKVVQSGIETFLGQSEFTRTHRLQVKTSYGADTSHMFNGKEFKLTVRFGFAKAYNMHLFPTDTHQIIVAGAPTYSLGFGNTDSRTIFNIQPGNEFHYKTYDEFCGFSGCRTETIKEKRFYLTRDTSLTQDSITLSYQRTSINHIDDPITGLDTVYTIDTQQQLIVWPQYTYLDGFNREDFHADSIIGTLCNCPTHGWSIITFNDSLGPRPRKQLFLDLELDTANACLYPSANAGYDSTIVEYGDGLGLTRFHDTDNSNQWHDLELVYYQKGIELWGEPIDFSEVTGLQEPQDNNRFNVYPNPASDQVYLDSPPFTEAKVDLLTATGQVIRTLSISRARVAFYVHDLPTGLYFVRVATPGETQTARFMKN